MSINLTRLSAIARKEFIQIYRDPRSLAIVFLLPLLLLTLFGYAVTLDVKDVQMAVYDRDRTAVSLDFINRFAPSQYLTVAFQVEDYEELIGLIDRGQCSVGLVIPQNFSKAVKSHRETSVQVLLDGSDSNRANIILSYLQAVVQEYSKGILLSSLARQEITQIRPPLESRSRVWFNEELESKNYIVPGLIAVIMSVIGALLTSLTVAREWERGTMEQLMATPVKTLELFMGKLIPYFLIGFADVLLCVVTGTLLFQVPLRGSLPLLFFLSALFLFVALGQGFLISVVTKNQLLASQVALVSTFLPAFLLSGFMFSIKNMPILLQGITYLIPARYFVTILQGIFLKGIGLTLLWVDMLFLAFAVLLLSTLVHKRFSKKLL